jgi:hypothetical protein
VVGVPILGKDVKVRYVIVRKLIHENCNTCMRISGELISIAENETALPLKDCLR